MGKYNKHLYTLGIVIKFALFFFFFFFRSKYTIEWHKAGDTSKSLLTYAYPHHLKSFSLNSVQNTNLKLQSSSKGAMQAVIGDQWILQESDLSHTEWFPEKPLPESSTQNEILQQLVADVGSNYTEHTQRGDNYFSGKGLQKVALIALLLNQPDITGLRNPELAQIALNKLKQAFVPYLENRQQDPFRYDSVYKGIVARDGLPVAMGGTGNKDAEFGHSYYNDHHYHQGYFVVTGIPIIYLLYADILIKLFCSCYHSSFGPFLESSRIESLD